MDCVVLKIGLYLTVFEVLHGLHIPLSDQFHAEKTKVEFLSSATVDRFRRDASRHLPDNTLLRLGVAGTLQHFHIEKNYKIDVSDIPIFISNHGEPERTYISLDQEHAVYQAPEIGGSFLVTRHNTSTVREIFGTFHHNSSLYVIQPDVSLETKGEGHIVSRVPDQQLIFDSITPTGASVSTIEQFTGSGSHDNRRSKRQIKTYSVELMSVIDYKSYKFWYDMTSGSNRRSDAVQLVMQYVAYIINSVDVRYKTIPGESFSFNILSAGIYIADTSLSSPWSEKNVMGGRVSSSATLASFTEWIKAQTSLPQFDHAMGFTGYDIVSGGTGDSSGIAYTSVLCTPDSTSIIEDSFNFITMTTAAHELGHSLGALHDGIGNTCDGKDNYIMASVNSVVTDTAIGQHLWQFSSCSAQEFRAYINKLDRMENNCMLKTSSSSKVATTLRPMAEAYPADETCVYRFGEGSYVCRSIQNYDTICITMYCNQPGSSQCYSTLPAEGTPCGKGKWCDQGKCVLSPRAPSNNADNCALGDRPGVFDDTGKTCAQYIEDDPAKCYGDYTGANCCESCNSKNTGDATCEFGDHGRSFCSTMPRYGCYLNEEYCCSTCKLVKNSALPGCEYGDKSNACRKEDCWRYNANDLANCCETCFDPSKTTTTTTKLTTTSTTPSTTTTTKLTTSSTTPSTTTTESTTSSTTPSTTTAKTTTIQSTQTVITPTQITVEPSESDWILIVAGCGAGAVLVIVSVVILCLILKRRKAKRSAADRKPSIDNSCDNIGFVSVMSEKPRHPPPRRDSNPSSLHNVSNGSAKIPVNFIGDGTSEHVDGYMMPASVKVIGADDVHYTAPNKPKLKPLVPPNKPKKKAFSAPKRSPDLSKRASKPVHYKRTSGVSNSSTETIDRNVPLNSEAHPDVNETTKPDGYDSIGEIQKFSHRKRPLLPQKHPRSLPDIDRVKNKTENENDSNMIDQNMGQTKNISDDEKRKVLPSIPPRPIPRIKSRNKTNNTSIDSSITAEHSNQAKTTEIETRSNGYEEMNNVKSLGDVLQSLRPPTKPVPRRHISSENEKPEVPLKKALRPPLKPVPRRRTSSENQPEGHSNPAFSDDQLEFQI